MGIGAAIGAGISVIGGIKGASDAKKAGKESAAIAAENAAAEARQTEIEVERMEADLAKQQSLSRARAAASGTGGTTMDVYMEALKKSGEEEVEWLKEVGASRYNQALQEGRTAMSQAKSMAWGSMFKGISGAASSIWG